MAKNLLPQSLGMKPGTSLIGQFGSTEMRFRPLPTNENPGPGAYGAGGRGPSTRLVLSSELKGGWAPGTALGHVLDLGHRTGRLLQPGVPSTRRGEALEAPLAGVVQGLLPRDGWG